MVLIHSSFLFSMGKDVLRIEIHIKGALFSDQAEQCFSVKGKVPFFPEFQHDRIRLVQIFDGEGMELVIRLAVDPCQIGKVHGKTEAGCVVFCGEHMMEIRMAGGVDAVQGNLEFLQEPVQHLGRIVLGEVEGKGNMGEFPQIRSFAEFIDTGWIRIREVFFQHAVTEDQIKDFPHEQFALDEMGLLFGRTQNNDVQLVVQQHFLQLRGIGTGYPQLYFGKKLTVFFNQIGHQDPEAALRGSQTDDSCIFLFAFCKSLGKTVFQGFHLAYGIKEFPAFRSQGKLRLPVEEGYPAFLFQFG